MTDVAATYTTHIEQQCLPLYSVLPVLVLFSPICDSVCRHRRIRFWELPRPLKFTAPRWRVGMHVTDIKCALPTFTGANMVGGLAEAAATRRSAYGNEAQENVLEAACQNTSVDFEKR